MSMIFSKALIVLTVVIFIGFLTYSIANCKNLLLRRLSIEKLISGLMSFLLSPKGLRGVMT